jgi:CheY-like chemotaxis protein
MPPPDLPDLSDLTLVAVDDDRESLELLRVVLKACGAHVFVSQTAAEALTYLQTALKVDALITDIAMPAMNGIELVRRARSHPSHQSLPAIAVTAYPERSGPEFNALLVKPISLENLCSAVRAAIDARRS